jgi:hypothetical protein
MVIGYTYRIGYIYMSYFSPANLFQPLLCAHLLGPYKNKIFDFFLFAGGKGPNNLAHRSG